MESKIKEQIDLYDKLIKVDSGLINSHKEGIRILGSEIIDAKDRIKELRSVCSHRYDDGSDAFEYIDAHHGYYKCEICGKEHK